MKKSSLVLTIIAVAFFGLGVLSSGASGDVNIIVEEVDSCPFRAWPNCAGGGCDDVTESCVIGRVECYCF